MEITIGTYTKKVEALFDTGFTGYVTIPPAYLLNASTPDEYQNVELELADGNVKVFRRYQGSVQIGYLGGAEWTFQALVYVIGSEPLIGREIIKQLRVVLDHGRRMTVAL